MDDVLRFLGKNESLAFLKDCVPGANRRMRRSFRSALGPWNDDSLREWATERRELVSLIFDPLLARARAAGLIDATGAWLHLPSETQFRVWVGEIAAETRLDQPRVALAIAAEMSAGSGDGREPSAVPAGAVIASPAAEESGEPGGRPGQPQGMPFSAWWNELAQEDAGWGGWEDAIAFADALCALAVARIEERSAATQRLAEVIAALAVHAAELDYLEKASWRSWSEVPLPTTAVGAQIERVEALSSRLSSHADARKKEPQKRSEERLRLEALEGLFAEIDALYAAIEAEMAAAQAARLPAEAAPVEAPPAPPTAPASLPVAPLAPSLPGALATLAETAPPLETPAALTTAAPGGDEVDAAGAPAVAAEDAQQGGEAAAPGVDARGSHALSLSPPDPKTAPPSEAAEPVQLEVPACDGPVRELPPSSPLEPVALPPPTAPPPPTPLPPEPTRWASSPPPELTPASGSGDVAPPVVSPPSVALEVPAELATPESFADAFSIAPDGRVVPAPWRSPDFGARLAATFAAELEERPLRFPRLWILSAASPAGESELPSPREVEELAAWWSGAGVRGQDGRRAGAIRDAYDTATIAPNPRWRVAVLLEALSASPTSGIDGAFIEEVVHQLELGDHGFEVALIELLGLRARVHSPVEWLRPLLEPAQGVPLSTAEERLAIRRREVFDYFRSVMQAGGGKIQQTHCREAWRDFIDRALPGLKGLFPLEHGGDARWDAGQKRGFVDGIERLHAEVADKRGARLKDRVRMDRFAERLAVYARSVNAAMAEVEEARQRTAGRVGDVSVRTEVFRTLAEGPSPPGPVGGLREILVRALFPRPAEDAEDPLELGERDIRRHPDLLELLPAVGGTAADPDFGSARDVIDARAAAAVLAGPEDPETTEPLPDLLQARERKHLLGRVVALCPEEDRVRVHAEQDAAFEDTRQRLAELDVVRLRLADAASPLAEVLLGVHRLALQGVEQPPPRPRLFIAWLEQLLAFGRVQLGAAGDAILVAAAQQGAAVLAQAEPLVAEQRFAEALTVLHGRSTAGSRSVRHTQSRGAAARAFPDPARRLAEPDVSSRLPRWQVVQGDHQQERALRTEFAKLVLEDLYPQHNEFSAISVRCDDLRQRIDERQLNPCYIPQLQRFGHVTIPRIVVRPADPQFPVRAADAAGQHPNDLVILLAPRITAARREAVLQELRRRSATAAVVDDLDLCRLINPGGTRPDALLSLLEIALEQQRWTAVSPFGVVEGQHVQLEMYVGRRDEARDLAHTSRYSRLFSGRKLGKSALLRYVEQRYDGRALPSGKTLRVLYVSAVGIDADVALVDQIVGCLANRCGPDPERPPRAGEEPAARLERVLARHVEKETDDSLLIVLDEADAFVEAELDRYQRRPHESCLSWAMSRRIESARDSQGLPRVRFVFTGYRVTNTRDGVWFNWSDVLQLVPLPADEAAELVAAPLARLGIDATEQAAVIAHRCGYQPAVLLRFGERLLARLEELHPPSTRELRPVSVSADDVAATFQDNAIQDEILRVTSNNFRDNDIGAVLFGVLLGLFLAMGPAAVLDAAEDKLIERLRALDSGNFTWMAQEGGNLREQIRGKLRDLVARQLLVERGLPGGRKGYSLKFPHHLTVLAPLAREERIREAVRRIQAGSSAVVTQGARGLLARGDFDVVRDLVTTRPDAALVIAPVAGHLWSLPPQELRRLLHRGLFDPLSLDRSRVFDATQVASALPAILGDASSLAFHGVRPELVRALVEGRPATSPMPLLVGGVDLLRHAVRVSKDAAGPGVYLQPLGFGRFLRGHLAWWFERARGFNFVQFDAIDRISAATSGIPLLVSFLDRTLKRHDPHGGGLEVTADLLAKALDELALHLDEAASLLIEGEPETRLAPREIEIARMLAFAARREGTTSWEDISEDLWPEYASALPPGSPLGMAAPIRAQQLFEDQVALEVLEQVGLVPSRPDVAQGLVLERLGPIAPTDALLRLAERLP